MTTDKAITIKHSEGSPWFWKIFGGTVVSIISVLLVAHISMIASNFDRSFLSLKGEIKDLSLIVDQQKERILSLEKEKDRLVIVERNITLFQTQINELSQRLTADTTNITLIKEEIKKISDSCKDLLMNLQNIREKLAASEAAKQTAERINGQNP